jgi:hypothetical protein
MNAGRSVGEQRTVSRCPVDALAGRFLRPNAQGQGSTYGTMTGQHGHSYIDKSRHKVSRTLSGKGNDRKRWRDRCWHLVCVNLLRVRANE